MAACPRRAAPPRTQPPTRLALARGLPALGTALWLVFAGPAAAQEPAPPPPAEAAPGTEPAPDPAAPTPPDVAEIPGLVERELEQLETERRQRQDLSAVEPIRDQLPDTREQIRERMLALGDELAQASSVEALLGIERGLLPLQSTLADWDRTLSARIERTGSRLSGLQLRRERWELARDAAREDGAPAVVLEAVDRAQSAVAAEAAATRELRDQLLGLQAEIGEARQQTSEAIARIASARQALLAELWVRSAPPLWRTAIQPPGGRPFRERVREQLEEQREGLVRLYAQESERGGLQLLLWLGAIAALLAARRRARAWRSDDSVPDQVSAVFERPVAIATLIALLLTPQIYARPPQAALELADLLLLFPALAVIRPLTELTLRPALFALAGFYIFDQLRDLVSGLPTISRLSFLVEMLLACAASAWLSRRAQRNGRPHPDGEPTREYTSRALRAMTLGFALVFLLGALGYMNLALLVGDALLGSAYSGIFIYALAQILQGGLGLALRSRPLRTLNSLSQRRGWIESRLGGAIALLGFGAWALVSLELFALRRPLFGAIAAGLGAEITLGSLVFSFGDVLAFVVTISLAVLLARTTETVLEGDIYPRLEVPRGTAYAFSTLLRYGLVTLGLLAAVSALGFDTDRLTVLVGAFGVGIGFGLQNIVNNFVSGLILLFERPVQIGDAIEVAGTLGKVQRIGIRATVVRTYDGSDVTIPNGQLLSERLSNWTLSDRHRRIEVPVGVAYGSDPDRVLELLGAAATTLPGLLAFPAPLAVFRGFGDSSLDFAVYAWVADNDSWVPTRSALVRAVHRAIQDAGIEIPFPQRDLHLRSAPGSPPGTPPEAPQPPGPAPASDPGAAPRA